MQVTKLTHNAMLSSDKEDDNQNNPDKEDDDDSSLKSSQSRRSSRKRRKRKVSPLVIQIKKKRAQSLKRSNLLTPHMLNHKQTHNKHNKITHN